MAAILATGGSRQAAGPAERVNRRVCRNRAGHGGDFFDRKGNEGTRWKCGFVLTHDAIGIFLRGGHQVAMARGDVGGGRLPASGISSRVPLRCEGCTSFLNLCVPCGEISFFSLRLAAVLCSGHRRIESTGLHLP